jgi:hypothetical protein
VPLRQSLCAALRAVAHAQKVQQGANLVEETGRCTVEVRRRTGEKEHRQHSRLPNRTDKCQHKEIAGGEIRITEG